jgi:hypothetical protein
MLCAAIVIRAIATCDFASMRHRPHRIVQPRLTTIMTYRPARGCPPNRAHSCLKSGRFSKARSIRRVVVVRPLVLARCLHANGTTPSRLCSLALCLSTIFSEDRDAPIRARRRLAAGPAPGTSTPGKGTLYICRLWGHILGPCHMSAGSSGTARVRDGGSGMARRGSRVTWGRVREARVLRSCSESLCETCEQSAACGSPPPRAYRPSWRCGRVAEGGGLLNRYRVVKPYRGFESLRLRQSMFSITYARF